MLTLDLSANNIGDLGAQALGEGLCDAPALQRLVLNLRANKIGDAGARSLPPQGGGAAVVTPLVGCCV